MEMIDMFGKSFEFTFEGKDKYKTKLGGYITIFTLCLFIYLAWFLGNEMIYKNLPNDYHVITINPSPRNLTFKVPFAFMIQDSRGNIIKDYDKYIVFNAYYYHLYRKNAKFENVTPRENLKLRKCVMEDFSEEVKETFTSLKLEYGFCLDRNKEIVLGGDFHLDFAKFVTVEVRPCYNTTDRNNCAQKEEILSFLNLKNLTISSKHEKILYNSKNYSFPVTKFIVEDNILIDPHILNFPRYLMEEFRVETDQGIIGTDIKINNSYHFGSMINDIITSLDNEGQLPNIDNLLLYEYSFFESSNGTVRVRSYLKLTDMLASLGGILEVYLMVVGSLFHSLYQRKMYEKVIKRLYNFTNSNDTKFKLEENLQKSEIINIHQKPLRSNNAIRQLQIKDKEIDKNFKIKFVSHIFNNRRVSSLFHIHHKKHTEEKKTFILSTCDHILLSFFPCSSGCSKKLKQNKNDFNLLINYAYHYTDVLQILTHFYELERLKFILFNKKQLAVFQSISIPMNPLVNSSNKKISKLYEFMYDEQAQKLKRLEFFSNEMNSEKINNRLKKLYTE